MLRHEVGLRKRDGFLDYRLDIAEHCGTHLDAPLHFTEGGKAVDEIPLDQLIGPLVVIDIGARAAGNSDALVERADVEDWIGRNGDIPDGAIAVMRSGWSQRWSDAQRYFGYENGRHHSPGWSLAAVSYLVEKTGVVGIGVDTASIDPLISSSFPVHRAWLGAGRWALENLGGLDRLPEEGAWLIAAVARIAGATGFPVRALALVPKKQDA